MHYYYCCNDASPLQRRIFSMTHPAHRCNDAPPLQRRTAATTAGRHGSSNNARNQRRVKRRRRRRVRPAARGVFAFLVVDAKSRTRARGRKQQCGRRGCSSFSGAHRPTIAEPAFTAERCTPGSACAGVCFAPPRCCGCRSCQPQPHPRCRRPHPPHRPHHHQRSRWRDARRQRHHQRQWCR